MHDALARLLDVMEEVMRITSERSSSSYSGLKRTVS